MYYGLYENIILQMLESHKKEMPGRTSLVIINSFDSQKDDIEEIMAAKHVYADVMEVDRLNSDHREEYLKCFSHMYGTRLLPLIFMNNKLISSGFDTPE